MYPFGEVALALVAFVIMHIAPARSAMRAGLIARMGRRAYLSAYMLVSLALAGWLVSAALRAPRLELWAAQPWQAGVAVAAMPFAAVFLVAGLASPNPLSIDLTGRPFDPDRPGIVAITRHPVLWGFALWAGAHGLANGHLVAAILFGVLGLFALGGMRTLDKRAAAKWGESRWRHLAGPTSIMPMAAILAGRARFPRDRRTALLAAFAVALYAVFMLWGHAPSFGTAPLERL